MCKAIEDYGDQRSEESRIETLFCALKNIMDTMNLNVEQKMAAIKVSDADRAILLQSF